VTITQALVLETFYYVLASYTCLHFDNVLAKKK